LLASCRSENAPPPPERFRFAIQVWDVKELRNGEWHRAKLRETRT
jgi:hypothetical protein